MSGNVDKGKFFSGLFVMLGLVVLGLQFPRAVEKFRSFDRTVNVKGLCGLSYIRSWPMISSRYTTRLMRIMR